MRTASPGVFTEFSRVPDRWENDLPCETTPKKAERGLPPPHSTLIQPLMSRRKGALGGPEPVSVGKG